MVVRTIAKQPSKMKTHSDNLYIIAVVMIITSCPWFSQGRTWTNKAGVKIEAEYISSDGESVTIKKQGVANPFTIPLSDLSKEDIAFVKEQVKPPSEPVDDLNATLEPIRAKNDLPALGGVAVVDGKLRALGAVGMRKHGGKEKVTTEDKWHIGSCTKSMTATLAATFVEEGALKWESTIGEILGDAMKVRDEYKTVTLKTLLTNRSGIPGKAPPGIWNDAWAGTGKSRLTNRRKEYAEAMLNVEPEFPPGSKYGYSNSGFVVAGVMLETIAKKSWEDLMKDRIFKPLQMESAGFGSTASPGKEDQPWGHHPGNKPQEPGIQADNPDVLGPAGTVHVSLSDLARYAQMHATREIGPVIKKADTYEILHTKVADNKNYACGWIAADRGWAKGTALTHNGSNTMNFCVIWIAPERKFAGIAVSNVGIDSGAGPCDRVVSKLVDSYLK